MSPTISSTSVAEFGGAPARRMHLLDEAVEDADPVAALEQRLGQMAADEACATGDQECVRHDLLPRFGDDMDRRRDCKRP